MYIWKNGEEGISERRRGCCVKKIGFEKMYENWRVERLKGGFFIFIGKRRKYVVRTLYLGCRGFQERFFED